MAAITRRAYARIGLLGNPSGASRAACVLAALLSLSHALAVRTAARADGFNGKTIALSLENYYAEARPARRAALGRLRHADTRRLRRR